MYNKYIRWGREAHEIGGFIMATRYVVQVYERYAIYEPAEGGYYYEGLEPFEEPEVVRYEVGSR